MAVREVDLCRWEQRLAQLARHDVQVHGMPHGMQHFTTRHVHGPKSLLSFAQGHDVHRCNMQPRDQQAP
jgi:hypothetical protein